MRLGLRPGTVALRNQPVVYGGLATDVRASNKKSELSPYRALPWTDKLIFRVWHSLIFGYPLGVLLGTQIEPKSQLLPDAQPTVAISQSALRKSYS